MRRKKLFRALALVVALLLSAGAVIGLLALINKQTDSYRAGSGDWPMEGKDPAHSAYLESGPQENPQEIWGQRVQQAMSAPAAVVGGRVYVGGGQGMLYCLKAETGEPLWGFDAGSEIVSTPCVTTEGIFFGTGQGVFYALDARGKEIWRREMGDAVVASPVAKNGRIYVGSLDHLLYCLQEETGETLWEYDAGEKIEQSPCIGDGYIFCLSMDGKIHALREETGELDWQSPTKGILVAPAMVQKELDEGKVFIVTGTNLYCLDTQTGKEVWMEETTEARYRSNVAVRGNQVLVTAGSPREGSNALRAFNILTSNTVWASSVGYSDKTSLVASRAGVYVATQEGISFRSFDNDLQSFDIELRGIVPQTLTVTSDAIYVATENFKVYCYRTME